MAGAECTTQLELFEVERQQVTLDFEGEGIVSDSGLLPVAQLDRELGILAEAASRLPDPGTQLFCHEHGRADSAAAGLSGSRWISRWQ